MNKSTILKTAEDLINRLWESRGLLWSVPPASRRDLLPIDLIRITQMLGLHVEGPEEIIEAVDSGTGSPLANTAGIVDPPSKRISIAQKFNHSTRRFTLAHEIAHSILHPNMRYHRDRPMNGSGRSSVSARPLSEREADWFAAVLLMPGGLLRDEFLCRYDEPIGKNIVGEELAYWLSLGTGKCVDPCFDRQPAKFIARLVAESRSFRGRHFDSLAAKFDVSVEAMAIRLLECHLVCNGFERVEFERLVKVVAEWFKRDGYAVGAVCGGFPEPSQIAGFTPHVQALMNAHGIAVVEIVTRESLSLPETKTRFSAFFRSNAIFYVACPEELTSEVMRACRAWRVKPVKFLPIREEKLLGL